MPLAPFPPPPWPTGDAKLDAARMEEYRSARAEAARESRIIGISVTVFFALVIGGLWFLISTNKPEPITSLFNAGDTVKMKLDGRVGMVLRPLCYNTSACGYEVRFPAANLQTDVHLIAPDGAVVSGAYSDVYVREFEMEAAR